MRKPGKGLVMLLATATALASTRADVLVEATPTPTSSISEQVLPGGDVVTAWRRGETGRMYVRARNRGPEIIDSAGWRPNIPANLQGHLTCANACSQNVDYGRPVPSEDFFSGVSLFWNQYNPFGQLSGAVTNTIGGGAQPGHSGNLEYYDFIVGDNAQLGEFDFELDLGGLSFGDPKGNPVTFPIRTSNYSFKILPKLGDANDDTLVDANDVNSFVQAMIDPAAYTLATGLAPTDACDMNGDGQADGKDIQGFVERIINGP